MLVILHLTNKTKTACLFWVLHGLSSFHQLLLMYRRCIQLAIHRSCYLPVHSVFNVVMLWLQATMRVGFLSLGKYHRQRLSDSVTHVRYILFSVRPSPIVSHYFMCSLTVSQLFEVFCTLISVLIRCIATVSSFCTYFLTYMPVFWICSLDSFHNSIVATCIHDCVCINALWWCLVISSSSQFARICLLLHIPEKVTAVLSNAICKSFQWLSVHCVELMHLSEYAYFTRGCYRPTLSNVRCCAGCDVDSWLSKQSVLQGRRQDEDPFSSCCQDDRRPLDWLLLQLQHARCGQCLFIFVASIYKRFLTETHSMTSLIVL